MQTLYKLPDYFKSIINHLVNTSVEVNFLDKIFKNHNVKKVLDVACGIGRHSIPLSHLDYDVTGIDFSPFQIQKAKEDGKKANSNAQFILQDANNFIFLDKFDAAICMWTTLGEEPMQYAKVIKNVFESLNERGIFIIDNTSWEHIPENKEGYLEDETTGPNGEKIITKIRDRFTENFRIRDVTHKIGEKEYSDLCITHLLREEDWVTEIKKAGFSKFEIYRDYSGEDIQKPRRVSIVAIK